MINSYILIHNHHTSSNITIQQQIYFFVYKKLYFNYKLICLFQLVLQIIIAVNRAQQFPLKSFRPQVQTESSNMGSSITIATTVLESYDKGYFCTITDENSSDTYKIYLSNCNEEYAPGSTIVFTGTYQGYPTDGEFYLIFLPEILYH